MAIQLLPLLATGGALVGGIQGFRRSGGNLGSAALGAGTGALTASGAGALGRFAGAKLLGAALPGGLTGAGGQALLKAAAAGNPTAAAALKIPALAGLGVGGTTVATGKLGVGPADMTGRGAAGLVGYKAVGNEGLGGLPVPPMGPYGNVDPTGDAFDVLNPAGLEAGRRLRTIKDAEALRDAQNIILPTVRKFAEQAKKDEFARDMAAYGMKQNIVKDAALTLGMADAARNLGTTAARQAGEALTQRYNY